MKLTKIGGKTELFWKRKLEFQEGKPARSDRQFLTDASQPNGVNMGDKLSNTR